MTTRPLIGLTGRRKAGRDIVAMPELLAGKAIDMYFADYTLAVIEAGGLPVYLPLDVDPADFVERMDGLLLPGGTDISPDRYGKESETEAFAKEPERDELELALMKSAVHQEIPVLGICRGHQVVNVYAGGTLHQDVPPHAAFDQPAYTEIHDVSFEADSILGTMFGTTARVNSLHHQTIDHVGTGLRVTARADDGTVEGLEHLELPIVSVQWHPEMMEGRATNPIFRWLTEAATEHAER